MSTMPTKWVCDWVDLENGLVDQLKKDDLTRVVYEQKCTYHCGNRILEYDEGEQCDIGDWAFHELTNAGFVHVDPITGDRTSKSNADVDTWLADSSDPKGNPRLSVGCTPDCIPN